MWPPTAFALAVWWAIAWRCAAGMAGAGTGGALLGAMAAGGWSEQVTVVAGAVASAGAESDLGQDQVKLRSTRALDCGASAVLPLTVPGQRDRGRRRA